MPQFDTQYSRRDPIYSEPGDSIVIDYAGRFDDAGRLVLDEVGRHDLYAEIQSHADSVDVNRILSRYAAGDVAALNQTEGFYADLTSMPKTYAEMFNLLKEGERVFSTLSVDERAKYNNSFEEFIINYKPSEIVPDLVPDLNVPDSEILPVKESAPIES